MEWFNSVSLSLLNKSLDGLWTREQAISDNIANYETTDYKRKYVSFEEQLVQEMEALGKNSREISESIQNSAIHISQSENETQREDGNGVDITYENVEMARTQLNYNYSTTVLSDYFSRLRSVINVD